MKIALYSRPHPQREPQELERLFEVLEAKGMAFQLNEAFARYAEGRTGRRFGEAQVYGDSRELDPATAVMVSYGGDGTFLEAVRMLGERSEPLPVLGINSGRLGFLANVAKEEMDAAFEELRAGRYTLEERLLLRAEGDFAEQPDFPCAFNELTIQRQGGSMVMVEVRVDGELVATCHGDGLLVSTPSGSTAYSLSVGGPVVSPRCNCLIISPIAPHNLSMRPVVVPDSSLIELTVRSREGKFSVSLDNQNHWAPDGASFRLSKAKTPVFLVRLQNISFYETLRDKMMWGIDSRDLSS